MAQALDTTAFIREGLSRYEDARETVNAFQTCIYDLIARVLDAKADWKHFVPIRTHGVLQTTRAQGAVLLHVYIAGHVPGRGIKERVWLSLGLYWSPPLRRSASVVVASTCWVDGMGALVPFHSPCAPNGVSLAPIYKKSELRLVADVGPDSDLEQVLTTLLDAADDALGPLPDAALPAGV